MDSCPSATLGGMENKVDVIRAYGMMNGEYEEEKEDRV